MAFPSNPNPGDSYTDEYGTVWVYAGTVNGWYRQTVTTPNDTSYTAAISGPAGSNTQVQFNDNGELAGDSGLTYNKTTDALSGGAFIPTGSTVPSNGLYRPSANNVALSTNGSERLRITSTGLVGIGTSAPEGYFDIRTGQNYYDQRFILRNVSTADSELQLGTGAGIYWDDSARTTLGLQIRANRVNQSYPITFWNGTPATNNGDLTTGQEAMRIDTSGRVGIGTTSPAQPLHVVGTIRTTTDFQLRDASNNRVLIIENVSNDARISNEVNGGSIILRTNSGSIQERARIDSSGRLLVGTSSSSKDCQIVSAGNSSFNTIGRILLRRDGAPPTTTAGLGEIRFSDGTSSETIGASIQASRDGGTWTEGSSGPGKLVFSTTADGASSPTEQLRITSDRYVRLASGTGGIQFNGDTAAANALDDYEEGTWTPSISGLTGFETPSGTYTKIGRMVYCSFWVNGTFNAAYTITNPIITSLPFAAASAQAIAGSAVVLRMDSSALIVNPTAIAGSGEVRIVMSNSGTNNPSRGFGGRFAYRV